MTKKKIRLYTDGSILKNLNGSYGWLIVDNFEVIEENAIRLDRQTISILELTGIKEGMISARKRFPSEEFDLSIDIYSDSRMSVKSLTTYYKDWEKRAKDGIWYATTGKPVINQDLIKEIKAIEKQFSRINYIHVTGHGDSEFNNQIDRAVREISAQ